MRPRNSSKIHRASPSLSALAPAWVWLAALLPRCVLCVLAWNDPQRFLRADAVGYLALARNIVLHGAFSSLGAPSFTPDTFRTPGYPVFLAPFIAVFPNPILPIAAAQCFLSALNAALIWRWLNDAWGRRAYRSGIHGRGFWIWSPSSMPRSSSARLFSCC